MKDESENAINTDVAAAAEASAAQPRGRPAADAGAPPS